MASKQSSNAKPKCSQCGIPIKRTFDLGRHMKERHGPPEVCPECGHQTHRKYRMDNHRKKKHGYPPDTGPLSVPQNLGTQQTPQGMLDNSSFGSQAHTSTSSQAHTPFGPQSRDREYLHPTNVSRSNLPPSEVHLSAMDYGFASGAAEGTTFGNFQSQGSNFVSMPRTVEPLSGHDFMDYSHSPQPPMDFTAPLEGQALLNYTSPSPSITGSYIPPSMPTYQNDPSPMFMRFEDTYQPLQSNTSNADAGSNYNLANARQGGCSHCGRHDHHNC